MLALAIAAFAIIAALVAGVLYLVREVTQASARERGGFLVVSNLHSDMNDLKDRLALEQTHSHDLDVVLTDKTQALGREVAARRAVEKQRDDLLDEATRCADPHAVAVSVRNELSKLSQLSQVSSAPAAASGPSPGALPGPAALPAKPKLP